MTRNHLAIALAASVAVFTLSACMQTAPMRDGTAPPMESSALGPGGYQGGAPYGADPDAHFHRLAESR